jgi:predicted MFS family arabinose efflux permease
MLPLFSFLSILSASLASRTEPHWYRALPGAHQTCPTCSLSERFGRKFTLYLLWCVLSVSIIIECVAKTWQVWLVAKLIAGMGVGTLRELISS